MPSAIAGRQACRGAHYPMKTITIVALIVTSSLSIMDSEAHAQGTRRFCDAGHTCFICPRGNPTCEISYAISRALTPPTMPSMDALLPPSPSTSPGHLYPERRNQYAPPYPQRDAGPYPERNPVGARPASPPSSIDGDRRGLTQEEWRQAIIEEAQRFCDRFPQDKQCHFKPPEAPPQ